MAEPVKKLRVGLYPGTFDPVTNGHLDVIARAARLLDKLVVGVAINTGKGPLFTLEERVELVEAEIARIATQNGMVIEVRPFDTLLIDFARKVGASMIVRGLRAVSDFDYEFQMAGMNYRMAPDVETVFLMASERHQFIASRLVKEVAMLGGDISSFVPPLTHGAGAASHPRLISRIPSTRLCQPGTAQHISSRRRHVSPNPDRGRRGRNPGRGIPDERIRRSPAEAGPREHAVHGPEVWPCGDPDVPRPGAEDGGADQDPRAGGVLRQHAVPSRDRRLHGAGRRPDRHRHRRLQAADLPAEFTTKRHFLRGTCGMARTGDPNSGNSQFFIMFAPAPHLDGQYTIWGQVVQGHGVRRPIEARQRRQRHGAGP